MTLTIIIVSVMLVLLFSVILIANRVRAKRRENEPIEIYKDGDFINAKGNNLDNRSTYDDRLYKKYESLAIWIKLRERYGKRLISYCVASDRDADRINLTRKPFGMTIYVKYVAEDGRVLTDSMYVKFLAFHELSLVTLDEHMKLKERDDVEFTVTQAEINAMKTKLGGLSYSDDKLKEFVYAEKKLAK